MVDWSELHDMKILILLGRQGVWQLSAWACTRTLWLSSREKRWCPEAYFFCRLFTLKASLSRWRLTWQSGTQSSTRPGSPGWWWWRSAGRSPRWWTAGQSAHGHPPWWSPCCQSSQIYQWCWERWCSPSKMSWRNFLNIVFHLTLLIVLHWIS